MHIWIIVVDLILAGAFFLSGLFFLFMACFGSFVQKDADHEKPARSSVFGRVVLILICAVLFGVTWYDIRCLMRMEFVPLPAVLPQAFLLWKFGLWTAKVVVNLWRHWRIKTIADSGRDDEAIKLIERWIDTSRQPGAELHNLLGVLHLKARDWGLAARQFRLAADMSDESAAYLSNLAIALNGMERTDEALEMIELAAQKDPSNADRYAFNRCLFLAQLGRTDEARNLLPQAERFYEKSGLLDPLSRRFLTETMSKIHHLCDRSLTDSVQPD